MYSQSESRSSHISDRKSYLINHTPERILLFPTSESANGIPWNLVIELFFPVAESGQALLTKTTEACVQTTLNNRKQTLYVGLSVSFVTAIVPTQCSMCSDSEPFIVYFNASNELLSAFNHHNDRRSLVHNLPRHNIIKSHYYICTDVVLVSHRIFRSQQKNVFLLWGVPLLCEGVLERNSVLAHF